MTLDDAPKVHKPGPATKAAMREMAEWYANYVAHKPHVYEPFWLGDVGIPQYTTFRSEIEAMRKVHAEELDTQEWEAVRTLCIRYGFTPAR